MKNHRKVIQYFNNDQIIKNKLKEFSSYYIEILNKSKLTHSEKGRFLDKFGEFRECFFKRLAENNEIYESSSKEIKKLGNLIKVYKKHEN